MLVPITFKSIDILPWCHSAISPQDDSPVLFLQHLQQSSFDFFSGSHRVKAESFVQVLDVRPLLSLASVLPMADQSLPNQQGMTWSISYSQGQPLLIIHTRIVYLRTTLPVGT